MLPKLNCLDKFSHKLFARFTNTNKFPPAQIYCTHRPTHIHKYTSTPNKLCKAVSHFSPKQTCALTQLVHIHTHMDSGTFTEQLLSAINYELTSPSHVKARVIWGHGEGRMTHVYSPLTSQFHDSLQRRVSLFCPIPTRHHCLPVPKVDQNLLQSVTCNLSTSLAYTAMLVDVRQDVT